MAYSNATLINGFETSTKIKSFNFTLGSTYQKKLKNDRKLTLGATYSFGTTRRIRNYLCKQYLLLCVRPKDNVTELQKKTSKDKNLIPVEASFGVGYGHDGKWFLSSQLDYKKELLQIFRQSFCL